MLAIAWEAIEECGETPTDRIIIELVPETSSERARRSSMTPQEALAELQNMVKRMEAIMQAEGDCGDCGEKHAILDAFYAGRLASILDAMFSLVDDLKENIEQAEQPGKDEVRH
jgi:hypothetical protein